MQTYVTNKMNWDIDFKQTFWPMQWRWHWFYSMLLINSPTLFTKTYWELNLRMCG